MSQGVSDWVISDIDFMIYRRLIFFLFIKKLMLL